MLPTSGDHEQSCCKCPCVGFCFQLLWGTTKKHNSWILQFSLISMCCFVRNCQTLPKWLSHFAFPLVMNESCCSTSSPALSVASVLGVGCLTDVYPYVIVILVCISLMTYNMEHIFIIINCHLCILFGKMSVQVFDPFFF